ncbi:hypothetical protein [Methanosarcina horonobensis]|uniref:hypothetical protein n=1 Tax=Methanosarcina horonobensis TaxID=418008 RepID=UPI000AFA774B
MKKKNINILKKARRIIDVPEPIAINKGFHCVLVSEYVPGKPLFWYFDHRKEPKKKIRIFGRYAQKTS